MEKFNKVIKEVIRINDIVSVEIPYSALTEEASRLLDIKHDVLRAEKRDFNKSFKGRVKNLSSYVGSKVASLLV